MSIIKQPFPELIAVVGATAVGKTAYAIELAQRLGGEIVSADSRQIYRRMDIGTAKPSAAERAAVVHHLLDLVDPDESFSLATYQELANAAITDIMERGRVPLLVGGSGQYLAAVLEGWQVPRVPPQAELRAELEAQAAAEGAAALHARLAAVDPAAARAISVTNVRRVVRALEVYLTTGTPISAQQTRQPPPYSIRTRWLQRPRDELYARVDARVDAMMELGLLEEVAALRAAGYSWELPAMSSLGYSQFRPYFEEAGELATCVERLKFDTHNFVRRQGNWFRRLPNVEMVTP
jgi:tRNA dimethylallyltransferase